MYRGSIMGPPSSSKRGSPLGYVHMAGLNPSTKEASRRYPPHIALVEILVAKDIVVGPTIEMVRLPLQREPSGGTHLLHPVLDILALHEQMVLGLEGKGLNQKISTLEVLNGVLIDCEQLLRLFKRHPTPLAIRVTQPLQVEHPEEERQSRLHIQVPAHNLEGP